MNIARSLVVVAMLSLAVGACSAGETESGKGLEVRLKLSEEATAADVGLPTYPGAQLYEEPGDSSSAANLGLSTPLFGFKVVAMKLETSDRPERVADFYRKALLKYGKVLECRDAVEIKVKSGSSDELGCDSNESDAGSIVYKVGTEQNQRIVAIKPHGSGTRFDLVYLNMRGESKQ
jgi:hypothetical protein